MVLADSCLSFFLSFDFSSLCDVREIGREGAVDDDEVRVQGIQNVVKADAHIFEEKLMDEKSIRVLVPGEADQLIEGDLIAFPLGEFK